MARFLERRRVEGSLVIVPLLLSPCEWREYGWLKETKFLPSEGKCLEINFRSTAAKKKVFLKMAQRVRILAKQLREQEDLTE